MSLLNNGLLDTTLFLLEDENNFVMEALVGSQTESSDTLKIIRHVNHIPNAQIDISQIGNSLTLSGANSTDPDGHSY